jgi:hypothetical protein
MYHVPSDGRHTPTGGALAAATPIPVREIVCGLPEALSDTVRLAARLPDADGENVTDRVHEAPAATVLAHVVVRAKSEAFEPDTAIPVIDKAAVPEFVNVTDRAGLVQPMVCEPKSRLDADSVTTGFGGGGGAAPVPVSVI